MSDDRCGYSIYCSKCRIAVPAPFKHGDLCANCEIERLRTERDEARDAARTIVMETKNTDPTFCHIPYWLRTWPWLKESGDGSDESSRA